MRRGRLRPPSLVASCWISTSVGGSALADQAGGELVFPTDLGPDLDALRLPEEQRPEDHRHERDGDDVREAEVDVPVRVVRGVELPQADARVDRERHEVLEE